MAKLLICNDQILFSFLDSYHLYTEIAFPVIRSLFLPLFHKTNPLPHVEEMLQVLQVLQLGDQCDQ